MHSATVASYIRTFGYHNTYWPGCGREDYQCETDFSKWTNAFGCGNGIFRLQNSAHIVDGGRWTFSYTAAEPNPEVLSYIWPTFWWPTYVEWWHDRC